MDHGAIEARYHVAHERKLKAEATCRDAASELAEASEEYLEATRAMRSAYYEKENARKIGAKAKTR